MELPEKVAKTLEEIRSTITKKISVKRIGGGYYLYEYGYAKKAVLGKSKVLTFYIGKIGEDGTFKEARHRFLKTRAKNIKEYLKHLQEESKLGETAAMPEDYELALLGAISMNARAPLSEVAKSTGLTQSTVAYRIHKLTQKYGIRYTLEMKPETFGFSKYMITAKFGSRLPDVEKLKEILEKEPKVQYASMANGDYNLIIYILEESNAELENFIYALRSNRIFENAPGIWYVSYLITPYGWYMPFRDEFFEMMKGRVWRRRKDSPRREKTQFLMSEYAVLKEMNHNSREKFSTIDRLYGMGS